MVTDNEQKVWSIYTLTQQKCFPESALPTDKPICNEKNANNGTVKKTKRPLDSVSKNNPN